MCLQVIIRQETSPPPFGDIFNHYYKGKKGGINSQINHRIDHMTNKLF